MENCHTEWCPEVVVYHGRPPGGFVNRAVRKLYCSFKVHSDTFKVTQKSSKFSKVGLLCFV